MLKRIICSYGVDVDAVARWPGSYGRQDSPSDISRGIFARTHSLHRMLNHSLETFPNGCAMASDAGHKIGLHGQLLPLRPLGHDSGAERGVLDRTQKMLNKFYRKPPCRSVAP
ncbi:unnamed protein product [Fusarium graminearum]|nr:unnamed protein product [Fusarium graminearum]CZS81102.1 unnamed protein product [Fusarium graminearum]